MSTAPQYPPDHRSQQGPREVIGSRRKPVLWKKILAWAGGIIGALVVLFVIAAFIILHSKTVHSYVLRVAQAKASADLGTKVSLRDFTLRFSGISPVLDLYDISVAGAPPHINPPLAQAERLHVVITVSSLLHRKWYVDDIDLLRPVVNMRVDSQGNSNLPKFKTSGQKSNTNVFDLGVRHASIENGAVYFNDRKATINADLHQLSFASSYDVGQQSYSGSLGYRDGHIIMQNFAPAPHQLDAEFVASPEVFTLKRASLQSGNSNLELDAIVSNYSNPIIHANYSVSLDSGEFRRILYTQSLPAGFIKTEGKLVYVSQANRPFIKSISVDGNLNSNQLLVRTATFRQAIDDLTANYKIANGNLTIPSFKARLLGGELTASLLTRDFAGNSHSHLTAALNSISLKSAQAAANTRSLRQVGLAGTVNGNVDAAWGKTLDDLVARADANIRANMTGNGSTNPVSLNSDLHARYNARDKVIEVINSFLRTPQTSLTINGTVSDHSALQLALQANDLHEFEDIAAAIRPYQPTIGLYGVASLHATVTGPANAPKIASQLIASNLKIKGTAWRHISADINADVSHVAIQNAELDHAQRGRIALGLTAGLDHWTFTDNSPVQLTLSANQINVAEIAHAAGMQFPVSGLLAASVSMYGSQQNPAGQGRILLSKAKIEDELVKSLVLQFSSTSDSLLANLDLQIPAGSASAKVTLHPKQKYYEAQLHADRIHLDQIESLKQRNVPLSGVINLDADGEGTFENPGLNATLAIPQLEIKNQTISGIKLQASIANHVGTFDLRSNVLNASISGHGTVHLVGDYQVDANLDTQTILLQPLLAAYAPSQADNIGGQTELHATIRGPLKKKELLEAHVTLPQLALNYKNSIQISASAPIHADYVNGVLQLQRGSLRGTGTDLQFQGTVPLTTSASASILLQGSVDLQLVQLLDPDIASSGQLKFDINSYGKRASPNVHGEVHIVNANFSTPAVPLGLQNANGVLTLLKDRLQITQFNGMLGGGTFSASGAVTYRPSIHFDIGLASKDTRALYSNIRGAFNTKLALVGNLDSAQLQGQVYIEQLQFTHSFDLMDFMGDLGGGASTPPPVGGFEQALRLNVGINSTAGVDLVSRTMSLQAAANLRLIGTAAQPVILGRINLNSGDMIFHGNRYVLQNGTVDFVNPSQTQPVVNVSVNTEVQQYNLQMHFWGPIDHLHTNYSSDPALPPSDIIHLIAFGNTEEASGANPSSPGNLAAEQLVASQVSGQITSRVEKVAGLSQLSVDPLLGTNQGESPGARITVQKRVTGKIFVTFSTDTTSTQNSVIKLEYQQSPRVSYSGTRDQNGGFGFDRRIHKEW